jgi:hypothetical protein
MFKDTDLSNYKGFLEHILKSGYRFVQFKEQSEPMGEVILRHDIDFDCSLALESARIEKELDIKSTFFFLLGNDSYNLFSQANKECVEAIRNLGHTVSIHFDPTIYEDFHTGFAMEKAMFEKCFEVEVDIISLHRPNKFFLDFDEPFDGVEHSYMKKYFKDIKYFADSKGLWRYGHPFNSEEFKSRKSLHVLVHPVWWMLPGDLNTDKLIHFYNEKKGWLKDHIGANCMPFNDIKDELD